MFLNLYRQDREALRRRHRQHDLPAELTVGAGDVVRLTTVGVRHHRRRGVHVYAFPHLTSPARASRAGLFIGGGLAPTGPRSRHVIAWEHLP